jgi:hypothetical protein
MPLRDYSTTDAENVSADGNIHFSFQIPLVYED